jgi:transcription elongation GreA/GreB family factor
MSRAFVKDDAPSDEPLSERHVSEHPNKVTPAGLERLRTAADELEAEQAELSALADDAMARDRLRVVERDLRYYRDRVATAIVVDQAGQPRDEVAFGATVAAREAGGELQHITIVGEDEADRETGTVSWVSPLGRVLTGARVGDTVTWRRPAGDLELTVEAIEYS